MNEQPSLADLYNEKSNHFRFKGDRPGESSTTRINELAIIGDAYLKLEVVKQLVNQKFTNSQITQAVSSVLSNLSLKEWAMKSGLSISKSAATHASGTLLEALVGYLALSKDYEAGQEIFVKYQGALNSLIFSLVLESIDTIKADWQVEDLFL